MKGFKAALFLTAVLLLCFATIIGYNASTDGFSVQQLVSRLPYNLLFEVSPLNGEAKENLKEHIDQPYRYIGKGCQFYAFESEDGEYVLKFLKQKHLRLWTELNQIPMPYRWREWSNQKIEERKQRVARLFSSCKLAYEEIPEESGLLYIHLNRTPFFGGKVCLKDKLGLKHQIDLDRYEFILQRKAIPLTALIPTIAKSDDFETQMGERIDQLVELMLQRCEKGIRDRDRSCVKNVAFMEKGAIFIDIGQFYKDPTILDPQEQYSDLEKRLGDVRGWVATHLPERSDQCKRLIEQKLSQLKARFQLPEQIG